MVQKRSSKILQRTYFESSFIAFVDIVACMYFRGDFICIKIAFTASRDIILCAFNTWKSIAKVSIQLRNKACILCESYYMAHILWFRVLHARNYLLRRWHKEIGRDHNNSSSSHLAVELIMVQGRQFCCTRSMKSCLLLRNMQIFQSTLDSLQARLHPFFSSLCYLVQMCFWRNLIPGTTMS